MSDAGSVDEVIKPALDAYEAEIARHGRDLGAPVGEAACLCGFPGRGRTPGARRRSVGLHVSAANRRADRKYDEHVERLFEAARAEGWR